MKGKGIKLAAKPLGRLSAREPRKSGRKEPDSGEVWPGKERLQDESDQGKAQKHQPVVDRLHHPSAQPSQIGRGSLLCLSFSLWETMK